MKCKVFIFDSTWPQSFEEEKKSGKGGAEGGVLVWAWFQSIIIFEKKITSCITKLNTQKWTIKMQALINYRRIHMYIESLGGFVQQCSKRNHWVESRNLRWNRHSAWFPMTSSHPIRCTFSMCSPPRKLCMS